MCFIFILFVWINHRPDLGCSTSNIYLLWVRTLCIFILGYAWLQCSNFFCTQKQANTYTKFIRILPVIGLQFWLCQNPPSFSGLLSSFSTFSIWNSMHDCIHEKQTFKVGLHTYAYISCAFLSLSLQLWV